MIEKRQFVITNDVQIHVRQWGVKNTPTLVFVHGYPDNSHVWDKTIRLLAHDFHVVAYDVRGAGLSTVPSGIRDYHLQHLATDFKAVIDATSPGRPVHLIAHDWGSIQSWEAVTDPAMAHRIASFTSLSGPCLDHIGFWVRDRIASRSRKGLGELTAQLSRSWYTGLFQFPLLAPLIWRSGLYRVWPALLQLTEGVTDARNATQLNDGISGINLYRANMGRCLATPRQRFTQIPVQLLIAKQDAYIDPALLDGMERWVTTLRREFVDSGHWLPLKNPALIAEKVSAFVAQIESDQLRFNCPDTLHRETPVQW